MMNWRSFFYMYEVLQFCVKLSLSSQLFANKTFVIAFAFTFIHTLLLYWNIYFMLIYFQAVLDSTSTRSKVQLLSIIICLMMFNVISEEIMHKTEWYHSFHHAEFALMTIELDIFTLLNTRSSTTVLIVFQILFMTETVSRNSGRATWGERRYSDENLGCDTQFWNDMRNFNFCSRLQQSIRTACHPYKRYRSQEPAVERSSLRACDWQLREFLSWSISLTKSDHQCILWYFEAGVAGRYWDSWLGVFPCVLWERGEVENEARDWVWYEAKKTNDGRPCWIR